MPKPKSPKLIFVFGSNLLGRHGAGAALYAVQHYGAVPGVFVGRSGNSYAIPTKGKNFETLSLRQITASVNYLKGKLTKYANHTKHKNFPDTTGLNEIYIITRIGCGLAGFRDDQIAPLFIGFPNENTIFDVKWRGYLEPDPMPAQDVYKYFAFNDSDGRLVLPNLGR